MRKPVVAGLVALVLAGVAVAAVLLTRDDPPPTPELLAGTGEPWDLNDLSEDPPDEVGDGGPATAAHLARPSDVAVAPDGTILIADREQNRVRTVDGDGEIDTLAVAEEPVAVTTLADGTAVWAQADGDLWREGAQDPEPMADASWQTVHDLAATPDGVLWATTDAGLLRLPPDGEATLEGDDDGLRSLAVTPDGELLAGTREVVLAVADDGGTTTHWHPQEEGADAFADRSIAVSPDGDLVASFLGRVRALQPDGSQALLAGTEDQRGASGDGGPAVGAALGFELEVTFDADGAMLIADTEEDRVRRVDPDGTITTIAGGVGFPFPDEALLSDVQGADVACDGALLLADTRNLRVVRLDPDGTASTFAGNGGGGFAGSGGPATEAQIGRPQDVAVGPDCAVHVISETDTVLHRVDQDGTLTTIAGRLYGVPEGDGGPAGEAAFGAGVARLAVTGDGAIWIAQDEGVRRIDPDGTIETVTDEGLGSILDIAATDDGSILVLSRERADSLLRRLEADGTLTTVAGEGAGWDAETLAVAEDGTVYVVVGADVRRLTDQGTTVVASGVCGVDCALLATDEGLVVTGLGDVVLIRT